MAGKYFLIDTTKCTACRGCQVACKEWNKLPATPTRQTGSYTNPPDLDGNTYRVVHFSEHPCKENFAKWYFFTEACRHCVEPPCKDAADGYVKGAVEVDSNGAVIFTKKTKKLRSNAQSVIEECPYNVPRLNAETGMLVKCHMCFDRQAEGLEPACAKSCPTGALVFGDEADIKKLAKERLGEAKVKFGRAELINPDEVRAIYLIVDSPEKYHKHATY